MCPELWVLKLLWTFSSKVTVKRDFGWLWPDLVSEKTKKTHFILLQNIYFKAKRLFWKFWRFFDEFHKFEESNNSWRILWASQNAPQNSLGGKNLLKTKDTSEKSQKRGYFEILNELDGYNLFYSEIKFISRMRRLGFKKFLLVKVKLTLT